MFPDWNKPSADDRAVVYQKGALALRELRSRLGDAALLGGVAMAAVIFDCLFWLFSFLRMGTIAFTAQAQGAGHTHEYPALLLRGFLIAAVVGLLLIALQKLVQIDLLTAFGQRILDARVAVGRYSDRHRVSRLDRIGHLFRFFKNKKLIEISRLNIN